MSTATASVVMLTGQGSEDIAVAAMKAGASDYVVKDTISAVGLRRAVNNAIDKTLLQQKLDSQQEEQELFIRTLLHDARAPLRHISTFSQLLFADAEVSDYSNAAEYCGDIQIATKRIEDLLDTLASYALSEADVTFEPVCMNDVIRAVLDNLAHRIQARRAIIRHEPLPTIIGHKPQLIQLLQNLVGNGIKYCKADQPVIEITVTASPEDGQQCFKVQDNGIGIPEDKLAYVFHPFKRLWSQDVYEGTGLGLAICQKIIKRHGGRIWCESQAGLGKHFLLLIGRHPRSRWRGHKAGILKCAATCKDIGRCNDNRRHDRHSRENLAFDSQAGGCAARPMIDIRACKISLTRKAAQPPHLDAWRRRWT